MKLKISILFLLLFSFSTMDAQDKYTEFEKDIQKSLKLIASYDVESINDNSAPHETIRQQKISNEYQKIMINLKLMEIE